MRVELISSQEEAERVLNAKLDKMSIEFGAELETITKDVTRLEEQIIAVNNQVLNNTKYIDDDRTKIINMGYTIDTIESRLEWKVEALQTLFNKSGECNNWSVDQLYQPTDVEEEHGASYEYPTDPNKSKEWTREKDYPTDEEEAYFKERAIEYEDLPRENDESYDLSSTKEDGEEELKDFYCCMTYHIPYEEVTENHNFRQLQHQEEAFYRGNPRNRPSPAPYDVYEDWEPVPNETMKMLHEKLDKIDSNLSRKIDDIAVRVRSIEDQRSKDAEAMERRLHCLEEEQERHLKSAQDNAINIRDLGNEVSDLERDHESKYGVLFNKELDTRRRVQKLENRAYEAESKMFGLEFEQKRFGEAMSEKFTFTKENHKLLKEIESEINEKNQDLDDKIENLSSCVAEHKPEEGAQLVEEEVR
ncbi:PREDICTED: uncharacterized protein LOC104738223 [Camelina sativa]|uniref:Uncharacterized protein LOC104738223 n=1 Tax=Camelina sativa TaxID=90675 RepID=A0ABM0VIJ2_CAMSA|nr:PREDICTED: uncharacterized protein LOC104738223 [Camelina sativa]